MLRIKKKKLTNNVQKRMYGHIGTIPQTNKESSLGLKKIVHLQIKQKKNKRNKL